MWYLIICAGLSALGCGYIDKIPFKGYADCTWALGGVQFSQPPNSNQGRSAVAYCKKED